MTDPLEKYRVMVRSIKFSPSSLDKHQPTTQVEPDSVSKPSPSTSLSWAKISSVLDSGPPVDPSEHIADLVRNAVSKHTVLPNSYAIPANIADRISQMSPTREVRPTIIQPPLPEPDPNWKPSISVIIPVPDVIISEKIEVITEVPEIPEEIISEKIEVITQEIPEEVVSEKTEVITEEVPEIPEEIISEKTEVITQEIPEIPEEIISEKTEVITQEIPEEITQEVPEITEEIISKKTEEITEVTQEVISEKIEEIISEKTEEITEVTQEKTETLVETLEKHSPILEIICPKCGSNNSRKNGFYKDKQRYACKDCGKQFVNESQEIITEIKPAKTATKESTTKGGFSGKSNNRSSKNKKKGKR